MLKLPLIHPTPEQVQLTLVLAPVHSVRKGARCVKCGRAKARGDVATRQLGDGGRPLRRAALRALKNAAGRLASAAAPEPPPRPSPPDLIGLEEEEEELKAEAASAGDAAPPPTPTHPPHPLLCPCAPPAAHTSLPAVQVVAPRTGPPRAHRRTVYRGPLHRRPARSSGRRTRRARQSGWPLRGLRCRTCGVAGGGGGGGGGCGVRRTTSRRHTGERASCRRMRPADGAASAGAGAAAVAASVGGGGGRRG